MANSAYLVVYDDEKLLMNGEEMDSENIAACSNYSIPLVWLSMFRPNDVHQCLKGRMLIAKSESALQQLIQSVEAINKIFSEYGKIDDYVIFMKELLQYHNKKYVGIQFDEIIDMQQYPEDWMTKLIDVLKTFEKPGDCLSAPLFRPKIEFSGSHIDKIKLIRKFCDISLSDARILLSEEDNDIDLVFQRVEASKNDVQRARSSTPGWLSGNPTLLSDESDLPLWHFLMNTCGLSYEDTFPKSDILLDTTQPISDDAIRVHSCLTGYSYISPVPWERDFPISIL